MAKPSGKRFATPLTFNQYQSASEPSQIGIVARDENLFKNPNPPPFQIEKVVYPVIASPLRWRETTQIHLLHPDADLLQTPDSNKLVIHSEVIKVHFPMGDKFYSEYYHSATGFVLGVLIKALKQTASHALRWKYHQDHHNDNNDNNDNDNDNTQVQLHRHVHKHVDSHHHTHKHVNYQITGDYSIKSGDILTTGNCVYLKVES